MIDSQGQGLLYPPKSQLPLFIYSQGDHEKALVAEYSFIRNLLLSVFEKYSMSEPEPNPRSFCYPHPPAS